MKETAKKKSKKNAGSVEFSFLPFAYSTSLRQIAGPAPAYDEAVYLPADAGPGRGAASLADGLRAADYR
ncbi:MAG: hypothetical protein LBU16_01075, partial [Treponema sp.]|nr:hypothetical protein [Treponema sp.]